MSVPYRVQRANLSLTEGREEDELEIPAYEGTVVLLFYSRKCPMCREALSWWRSLVRSYRGSAVFLAVPYKKETRRLFEHFMVTYIPTVIILKDRRVVKRIEPVRSAEEMLGQVVEVLVLSP